MRVISVAVAMLIVVTTGVAWGKIRSFESGINHINPMALGDGGEDGAIEVKAPEHPSQRTDWELVSRMRASFCVLGPLVARTGLT